MQNPASNEDLPGISPPNPLPDKESNPELLAAPWDIYLGSLVTEKPRLSPVPFLPKNLRAPGELALEKPSVVLPGPSIVKPAPGVPASGTPSAGAPVASTPRPSNPAMMPRPASPPSPFLKELPEPDLRPTSVPAAAPEVEYEDVTARPGDDVYFQFSPQGWTFIDRANGGKDAGYQSMDLKDPARTVFLFRPPRAGTFSLEFRRLDLATGVSRTKQIRLKVIPEGETIQNRQVVTLDLTEVLSRGSRLESAGKTEEALELYLSHYDPASQELNWRLGNLYKKTGDKAEAEMYWKNNLDPMGAWTEPSWLELISAFLQSGRTQDLLIWADWGRDKGYVLPEELLLRSVDQMGSKGLLKDAFYWLEEYGKHYSRSRKSDQALFIQAQLLEREGPYRNIREALRIYRQIIKDHPLSPWWTTAGERAGELERQFLRIR